MMPRVVTFLLLGWLVGNTRVAGVSNVCGGTRSGDQGTISSPANQQSRKYDNNMQCEWTITVDQKKAITLSFNSFDVEDHRSCSYDSVSVYDGDELKLKACGIDIPQDIISSSNTMKVVFKTDHSITRLGFVAQWTAVNQETVEEGQNLEFSCPLPPKLGTNTQRLNWRLLAVGQQSSLGYCEINGYQFDCHPGNFAVSIKVSGLKSILSLDIFKTFTYIKCSWGSTDKEKWYLKTKERPVCKRRVCYYNNKAQYRKSPWKFWPENIDVNLCTHLIYFNANLTSLKLIPTERNDLAMYASFNGLKTKKRGLKTLLSVKNYWRPIEELRKVVASAVSKKLFFDQAIKFLRDHNFDGIDLAWGYPIPGSLPGGKHTFTLLVHDFRHAADIEASLSGKPPLLITAKLDGKRKWVNENWEVNELSRYVDFLNVMTYDFFEHRYDGPMTRHHAPLYTNPRDTGENIHDNIDSAMKFFIEQGAPKEKLNVGLALFGRGVILKNRVTGNGPFANATGPSQELHFTKKKGYMSYFEVCNLLRWDPYLKYDPQDEAPYTLIGTLWVSYQDEQSIRTKVRYALDEGIGGVFVWDTENDDFRGIACKKGKNPLMKAVTEECGTKESQNSESKASCYEPSQVMASSIKPSKTCADLVSAAPTLSSTSRFSLALYLAIASVDLSLLSLHLLKKV